MANARPADPTLPAESRAASRPRLPGSWAAAFGVAILAVYVWMTPPVPGDGDSGELTIVLARASLAHPTGYPLYTLVGHLFAVAAHAAGATWAFAAALWSAVGGALAAFFFFLLADRLAGDVPVPGRITRLAVVTAPSLLFALNPMVTFEATHAEVYSWHLAWVCGAGLLFARIAAGVLGGDEPPPRRVLLAATAWGLACGAAFAHHRTAALVAAPMTLALLGRLVVRWPRRLLPAAAGALAALVPLASYGFVFWRAARPDDADWVLFDPTPAGALDHIRAAQYGSWILGGFEPAPEQALFLRWWIYPWLFPGLAVLGAAALLAPARTGGRLVGWTLFAAALAGTAFAFRLRVADPAPYFLAPLALGLVALAPAGAALARKAMPRRGAAAGVAVLLAALVLGGLWVRTGLDRKTTMIELEALVRGMWRSIPSGPGIVFWNADMCHRLRGFQLLDGEKAELQICNVDALSADAGRAKFRRRNGFDPFDGLPADLRGQVAREEYHATVARNVNRQSPLPVYEFEPLHTAVRLLRKP